MFYYLNVRIVQTNQMNNTTKVNLSKKLNLKIKLKKKRMNQSVGFWITIKTKSLSGATIISCFFERTRRNVKSFDGSKSRTTLLALSANWLISPAYWTVVVLSRVLLTGIPFFLKKYWLNKKHHKQMTKWHHTFIIYNNCSNNAFMTLYSF